MQERAATAHVMEVKSHIMYAVGNFINEQSAVVLSIA